MGVKKKEVFMPSDADLENQRIANNHLKIALSVEKTYSGYNLVKYKLDDSGHGIKGTITYQRRDKERKDTPSNRVVYSTQDDCMKEVYKMYEMLLEMAKNKKKS